MRRIRISTWVLTVIFLAALVTYLLIRPSSASILHAPPQPQPQRSGPASTRPGMPLPGVIPSASPHGSPASSPSPG